MLIPVPVEGKTRFVMLGHVTQIFPGQRDGKTNTNLELVSGNVVTVDISFEEFQEKFLQMPRQEPTILVPQPQVSFGR